MSTDLAKTFEPSGIEDSWYAEWEKRGYFHSENSDSGDSYTIVIPPPNVTGMLHLGHVLNNTLQDILIRWEKTRGKNACWVPGTDHAGIATQSKVETLLREKENLHRNDLGREKVLERVWEWKEQYGGTIINQLRKLGCACDWEREKFTLDDDLSAAVTDVFVRLHEKGLIYKGQRIINWCPKSLTALSDEEVIHKTENSHLWYMQYPLTDGSGHITVATTRPETMLGDTAVAVNPDDERYAKFIGKTITLPINGREIPIIADDFVKPEFGTGAVKVTPAHDPNDYNMGMRHKLEIINLFHTDASMNENAGPEYEGMDRFACRKAIVTKLDELGLMEKIEDYVHDVGYSERGDVPVEPRVSEQWFVKMESLAAPALKAVLDGEIKFHPPRWVNTYRNWLENIQDWCISRQLWWGHQIPAWYDTDGKSYVAHDEAEVRSKYNLDASVELRRDDDVLDTWFSSWLWPMTVFRWPDETKDLSHYYPTSSLVTGPDIIFFWVARMIMAGIEFTGEIPFKNVFFTSIIRDGQGRKMSKQLGNSPDPIDVINKYGTDALRFTMIYLAPLGNDIRFTHVEDETDRKTGEKDSCELGRNFATKIWNAARFRAMQGDLSNNWSDISDIDPGTLRPDDQWIIARSDYAIEQITHHLENFDFHHYALELYEFIWNQFCDWYVESAKSAFYSKDEQRSDQTKRIFDNVFSKLLRLIYPCMPFITEELYHNMGYIASEDSIMVSSWPEKSGLTIDPSIETLVNEKFELIRTGRNLRGTYNISTSKKVPFFLKPNTAEFEAILAADLDSIRVLLNAESITVDRHYEATGSVPSGVSNAGSIYLPLDGVIDKEAELDRLGKQKAEIEKGLNSIEKKLSNENFIGRAPAEVVEKEKGKKLELAEKLLQVNNLISQLK